MANLLGKKVALLESLLSLAPVWSNTSRDINISRVKTKLHVRPSWQGTLETVLKLHLVCRKSR